MVLSNNSFILSCVVYKNILSSYEKGFFSKKRSLKKIEPDEEDMELLSTTDDGIYSEIKNLKDTNVFVTTGHSRCVYFQNNEAMPKGGRCDFCKRDFDWEILGYPIEYKKYTLEIEGVMRVVHVFWIEGTFCKFECVNAHLLKYYATSSDFDSHSGPKTRQNLNLMFQLAYPGETLKATNEPALLIENGGSLTPKQCFSEGKVFVKTNKILLLPVKRTYLLKTIKGDE